MVQAGPFDAEDFREAAVNASRAFLATRRITNPDRADLSTLGVSLCVPAPGDPKTFRRALGVRLILLMILGFGGLLAGFILARLAKDDSTLRPHDADSPLLWVGLAASACGILLLIGAARLERWTIVGHLRRNAALRPATASMGRPTIVSVEDPQSFDRIKLVAEDVGELFFDPIRRLMVLEGYSHRCVIRAQDVIQCYCRNASTSMGVVVVFLIAGTQVPLSCVLIQSGLGIAFRRKFGLSRSPLASKIEDAIGVQVPQGGALV